MSNNSRDALPEWRALTAHQIDMRATHIRDLFAEDAGRFDQFHIRGDGFLFDYSKHNITGETIALLTNFARACDLETARDDLFSGAIVNVTENRAAHHTALRAQNSEQQNYVQQSLQQMKEFCEKVRGDTSITDVVVLGIGGSICAPEMACRALAAEADGPRITFMAHIDGQEAETFLKTLSPQNTIILVVSKTFTSLETLKNANLLRDHIAVERFYGVTENIEAAKSFGLPQDHIFEMKNWIGGRYSVWSAVGLPLALSIGFKKFEQFLAGAQAADDHFLNTPLDKNIPVLMAMLGIWYRNFWNYNAHAILPYCEALNFFPAYVQQLDMESNGKSVSRDGAELSYNTGPVIFGGVGTQSQHTFFQHLHQGSDITPCDFIAVTNATHDLTSHHNTLIANALAQAQALMSGRENSDEPHRHFDGNRPSSMFLLNHLTPHTLGMIMAFYEHKIFVQGVIWNVESFDQWGVELGKVLARDLIDDLDHNQPAKNLDPSTTGLLAYIKSSALS